MRTILCALACASTAMLSGCGTADNCSQSIGCARGNYRACGYATGSCHVLASDGSVFQCASCDCDQALLQAAHWCDGSSGGNGGSGNEPQVCADYIACVAQLSPATLPAIIATYGPSGSCWNMGTAIAASCTTACQTGIAQAKATPNAPAACAAAQAACNDGTPNGTETDVDCGGDACPACTNGRTCKIGHDCVAGSCSSDGHCSGGGVVVLPASALVSAATYQGQLVPPGGQLGYAVQLDLYIPNSPNQATLRWTGSSGHIFSGSISAGGTLLQQLNAPATGIWISAPYGVAGGMRVDFRATDASLSGFAIESKGGANNDGLPLYFELEIDGKAIPQQVWYAANNSGALASPTVDPFGI